MKNPLVFIQVLAFLAITAQAQIVTDIDGNTYDTIIIGSQVWFKENLKVTRYNNGEIIPNITDSLAWSSLTTGARSYFDNDSSGNDSIYGPLYNWYAVSNSKKICPVGWHVPTDAEWTSVETFLGGSIIAGGKMKESGTFHWLSPNTGATNSSGFTSLPGGCRYLDHTYQYINENGLWWTYTSFNSINAWSRYMWYLNEGVDRNPTPKKCGLNVRCIKNSGAGINDYMQKGQIKLYPNPSNSIITIEYNENRDGVLSLYNISGEIIFEKPLTNYINEIDINTIPAGIYIIKIIGEQTILQQKLIKE